MKRADLTISRTARRAGIGVETIRYYERRGLIEQPEKPKRGFRRYPPETLDRLRFIRRAQELGFTLEEVRALLELGDGSCSETEAMARLKLRKVEGRIRDLQAMRGVLESLVHACESNRREAGCPLIAALSGDADPGT